MALATEKVCHPEAGGARRGTSQQVWRVRFWGQLRQTLGEVPLRPVADRDDKLRARRTRKFNASNGARNTYG